MEKQQNARLSWLFLCVFVVTGCASFPDQSATCGRRFDFATDTVSYINDLVWDYKYDPVTGKTIVSRRQSRPDYTHHCFVVARTVRQFFYHARFDPAQPRANENEYRRLVRKVVSRSKRRASKDEDRLVVPGYAGLREFSHDWEKLLKQESGSSCESYTQCGNWRMIFPFNPRDQRHTARRLADVVRQRPTVVHVVRFPQLTINHALLLFDVTNHQQHTHFVFYDPNDASAPGTLTFDPAAGQFQLPRNGYFAGGHVDVYEIYRGICF